MFFVFFSPASEKNKSQQPKGWNMGRVSSNFLCSGAPRKDYLLCFPQEGKKRKRNTKRRRHTKNGHGLRQTRKKKKDGRTGEPNEPNEASRALGLRPPVAWPSSRRRAVAPSPRMAEPGGGLGRVRGSVGAGGWWCRDLFPMCAAFVQSLEAIDALRLALGTKFMSILCREDGLNSCFLGCAMGTNGLRTDSPRIMLTVFFLLPMGGLLELLSCKLPKQNAHTMVRLTFSTLSQIPNSRNLCKCPAFSVTLELDSGYRLDASVHLPLLVVKVRRQVTPSWWLGLVAWGFEPPLRRGQMGNRTITSKTAIQTIN